jgi:hypothetical protein
VDLSVEYSDSGDTGDLRETRLIELETTTATREELSTLIVDDISSLNRQHSLVDGELLSVIAADIDKLVAGNVVKILTLAMVDQLSEDRVSLQKHYALCDKSLESIHRVPFMGSHDLPGSYRLELRVLMTTSFTNLDLKHQRGIISSFKLQWFDFERDMFVNASDDHCVPRESWELPDNLEGSEASDQQLLSSETDGSGVELARCFNGGKSFFIASYQDSRELIEEFVTVSQQLGKSAVLWTFTDGLQVLGDRQRGARYYYDDDVLTRTKIAPLDLFSYIKGEGKSNTIYLLEDFHYYLSKESMRSGEFVELISMIKSMNSRLREDGSSIVVLAPTTNLPPEIAPIFEVIRHHLGKSELVYLEKYGTDLTKQVESGKLKPVVGRDDEIIQCLKVLSKMETNNPLLVGGAGVGKTAVVEGLAQMLAAGRGPKRFAGKRVISLNLNSLVSETKYRGEFEQRLEEILDEVRSNSDRLIIFIDEIHTLLNLGATEGAAGAGNILKPVLARGEFPCIGATTPDEFHQFIATDQALCRRFQLVKVEEPSASQTLEILRGIKGVFEEHHQVKISDKSLKICVELTERHLLEQSFPGKAIKMLDSACAAAAFESLDEVKPNFIKHEFERMEGY